jgi:hypothetical protein
MLPQTSPPDSWAERSPAPIKRSMGNQAASDQSAERLGRVLGAAGGGVDRMRGLFELVGVADLEIG